MSSQMMKQNSLKYLGKSKSRLIWFLVLTLIVIPILFGLPNTIPVFGWIVLLVLAIVALVFLFSTIHHFYTYLEGVISLTFSVSLESKQELLKKVKQLEAMIQKFEAKRDLPPQ